MLFMQKERNISEYIDFITYQDDAIIQRPLRYYRRRGQPHPNHQGKCGQVRRNSKPIPHQIRAYAHALPKRRSIVAHKRCG